MKLTGSVFLFIVASTSMYAQDLDREWLEKLTFQYYPYPTYPLGKTQFQFIKSVGERILYTDNVLQSNDEESDMIFSTYLNLGVGYKKPVYDINLDLLSNYDYYSSNSEFSGDEHRAYLQSRYAAKRFFIGGSLQYRKELQPFDTFSLDKIEREDITYGAFGGITLTSRLTIEPDVKVINTEFEDDIFKRSNNVTTIYGALFSFQLAKKRDLIVEFVSDEIAYDEDTAADSTGVSVRGGVRGDLTDRLKSLIKLGITKREGDENSTTGESNDETFLSGDVILIYELTSRTKSEFSFSRTSSYSISGDFDIQSVYLLKFSREFTQTISGILSLQYGDSESAGGADRTSYGASFQVQYEYSKAIILNAGLSSNKYKGSGGIEDADSNTVFVGANLTF